MIKCNFVTEVDSHVLYKDLGNRNLILLKLWKPTGFHHIVLALERRKRLLMTSVPL